MISATCLTATATAGAVLPPLVWRWYTHTFDASGGDHVSAVVNGLSQLVSDAEIGVRSALCMPVIGTLFCHAHAFVTSFVLTSRESRLMIVAASVLLLLLFMMTQIPSALFLVVIFVTMMAVGTLCAALLPCVQQ